MVQKLSAAQRRYIENALLIAALGLTFKKLEEDYETKPLGDIADTTSGGTPLRNTSTYYGGNIPWIKSGELNDNLIEEVEEYITEEGLANSSAKIYPKGTLVVALYGATVGKTGILGLDAASNQAVCAVFPKTKETTNEFVFWFLRHKRPEFLGMSFGGAQPNISQKIIRETLIPIPSLELQKKLSDFFAIIERRQNGDASKKYPTLPDEFADVIHTVELIESLAARVNEAQRLREEADEEANSLERSILDKIYKSCVAQFGTVELADACDTITDGDHITPKFADNGVKFIFVGNVSSGFLHFRNCKYVVPEYFEKIRPQRKAKLGDILYSAVGATLGIPAIVDQQEDFCFQRHIAIIKPNRAKLDSKFLWYLMRSATIFDFAWANTTGSAQPTVPLNAIRKIPVVVPPLDEQRRIVAYLDGLQAKVNALRGLQSETQEELDALLPSVLDMAFRGEL